MSSSTAIDPSASLAAPLPSAVQNEAAKQLPEPAWQPPLDEHPKEPERGDSPWDHLLQKAKEFVSHRHDKLRDDVQSTDKAIDHAGETILRWVDKTEHAIDTERAKWIADTADSDPRDQADALMLSFAAGTLEVAAKALYEGVHGLGSLALGALRIAHPTYRMADPDKANQRAADAAMAALTIVNVANPVKWIKAPEENKQVVAAMVKGATQGFQDDAKAGDWPKFAGRTVVTVAGAVMGVMQFKAAVGSKLFRATEEAAASAAGKAAKAAGKATEPMAALTEQPSLRLRSNSQREAKRINDEREVLRQHLTDAPTEKQRRIQDRIDKLDELAAATKWDHQAPRTIEDRQAVIAKLETSVRELHDWWSTEDVPSLKDHLHEALSRERIVLARTKTRLKQAVEASASELAKQSHDMPEAQKLELQAHIDLHRQRIEEMRVGRELYDKKRLVRERQATRTRQKLQEEQEFLKNHLREAPAKKAKLIEARIATLQERAGTLTSNAFESQTLDAHRKMLAAMNDDWVQLREWRLSEDVPALKEHLESQIASTRSSIQYAKNRLAAAEIKLPAAEYLPLLRGRIEAAQERLAVSLKELAEATDPVDRFALEGAIQTDRIDVHRLQRRIAEHEAGGPDRTRRIRKETSAAGDEGVKHHQEPADLEPAPAEPVAESAHSNLMPLRIRLVELRRQMATEGPFMNPSQRFDLQQRIDLNRYHIAHSPYRPKNRPELQEACSRFGAPPDLWREMPNAEPPVNHHQAPSRAEAAKPISAGPQSRSDLEGASALKLNSQAVSTSSRQTSAPRAAIEFTRDSEQAYRRHVDRFALLSEQDEFPIALKAQMGDPRARQMLVEHNQRLVISTARRYLERGLSLMELVQEGNVGMLYALKYFDPARGLRFGTYARRIVKQYIEIALPKARPVRISSNTWAHLKVVKEAERGLKAEAASLPGKDAYSVTTEAIAKRAGLSTDRVEAVKYRSQRSDSLDAPLRAGEDGDRTLMDIQFDSQSSDATQHIASLEITPHVRKALSELPDRERKVLEWKFGLSDQEVLTNKAIGEKLELTGERARQLEANALRRLRFILSRAGVGVDDFL